MRYAPLLWLTSSAVALFLVVPYVSPQWASPAWAFGWMTMAAALGYYFDVSLFKGPEGESQRPGDFHDRTFRIGAWYRRAAIIGSTLLAWAIVAGGTGGL